MKKKKETKKVEAGLVFSWIFGILFFLGTFNNFIEFNFKIALTFLIMGLAIFPPLIKIYKEKFNFEVSSGLKVIIVLIGFFLVFLFVFTNLLNNFSDNLNIEDYNEILKELEEINNTLKEMKNFSYMAICIDGSEIQNIWECSEVKNFVIDSLVLDCSNQENKNIEKILLTRGILDRRNKTVIGDGNNYWWAKWYPSLEEGELYLYPLEITNIGCTKLFISDFSSTTYFYKEGEILHMRKNSLYDRGKTIGDDYLTKELYPEDKTANHFALFLRDDEGLKINEAGIYTIYITLYHKGELIGLIEEDLVLE